MTQNETMKAIRALGFTVKVTDGEFRIALRGPFSENGAHYTNDRDDALGTAQAWAKRIAAEMAPTPEPEPAAVALPPPVIKLRPHQERMVAAVLASGATTARDTIGEIGNLLVVATNCLRDATGHSGERLEADLGSAAWRLADAARLLAIECGLRNIIGTGITDPTGRGALLPIPRDFLFYVEPGKPGGFVVWRAADLHPRRVRIKAWTNYSEAVRHSELLNKARVSA